MNILTQVLQKNIEEELSFFQNILISKCWTITKHEETLSEMSKVIIEQRKKIISLDSKLTQIKKEILEFQASDHEKLETIIELDKKLSVKTKDLTEHIFQLKVLENIISEYKQAKHDTKQIFLIFNPDNAISDELVKVVTENKQEDFVMENLFMKKDATEKILYDKEGTGTMDQEGSWRAGTWRPSQALEVFKF